ncbi:MAG: hypothetical protein COZ52_04575 [Candidatus Aenigmarchaeota archaeon CG_4_8_14_3_um_filter_37_24]|nr:MAG: hypothetical protein COZ52_04575 [Candidatus Aenigmarchaeota archaeon CG_4_8_14_3_um_filter_37_24]
MLLIGIFTLLGFIIVLGFLSNFFFKTTGIPDIILLLFLGLLLGPILNFVDPFIFEDFSQAFSALALMILLFESGLNLKLYKVFKESPRAILLAVVGIILTMSITFLFARFLLGWDLLPGLLLGAIVGGSSSSIVAPLMRKVNASNNIATLLTLESTFTDALTVIIAIGVIQLLMQPAMNTFYSISHVIASAFSIGSMSGLLIGVVWLKILKALEGESYKSILTLAIVLLLYSFTESLGGNGAISSLMFGLVIGNAKTISHILRSKEEMKTEKEMKEFHSEISFLVRTFFFVYLGVIVAFNSLYIVLMGVLLSVLILIGRIFAVCLSSINDNEIIKNRSLMIIMLPRGLAAAVLSQLPLYNGLSNANIYLDIVLTVIVATVIMCTIGVFIFSRSKAKNEKRGKS